MREFLLASLTACLKGSPQVKVRIHELADELDISERTVITWLSRKGYPGARANDWLTPKLARTVRLALSRSDRPVGFQSDGRQDQNHASKFSQRLDWLDTDAFASLPPQTADHTHLRETERQNLSHSPAHERRSPETLTESEHDALQRERARSELLLKRLEGLREHHERRYQELRVKYESTVDERTQLRQRVYAMTQDQETLDLSYQEKSQELEQTRREVDDLKRHLQAQQKMATAIDKVNQQKQAWRARALALEEKVQTNQHLTHQLKELGMDTLEQQVQLFKTLLQSPESAHQLFKAIKMVEHDEVRLMVERWVVKTCVNPLCHQVNTLRRKLSLRVDRPHRCEVCRGDIATRWFQRMLAACERSHVKRFLLVGGERLHDKIRELSEGKMIEFRLIPSDDESSEQRIQSRLGSCDLLITWPRGELSSMAGMRYRSAAPVVDCPLLDLNGDEADLASLSRHILHWISRTGGRLS